MVCIKFEPLIVSKGEAIEEGLEWRADPLITVAPSVSDDHRESKSQGISLYATRALLQNINTRQRQCSRYELGTFTRHNKHL